MTTKQGTAGRPSRTIYDLLKDLLGTEAVINDNPVRTTIGVSALQILQQDPNRVAFLIFNLSANTIFISPFQDVASTKGMVIGAQQGLFFNYQEDLVLPAMEWFAISAAGAANTILIVEVRTQ